MAEAADGWVGHERMREEIVEVTDCVLSGFPAGTLRMARQLEIRPILECSGRITYQLIYVVEYNPGGWPAESWRDRPPLL